jgi:hypothetical protein
MVRPRQPGRHPILFVRQVSYAGVDVVPPEAVSPAFPKDSLNFRIKLA